MVGRVRRVERMVEGEGRRLLGRGRGLQRVAGEPHRAGVRGWEGGWRWVARGGGGGPGEGEEQCCQQCTLGICEVTRQQCTMGMCPHHVSCLLAAVNWGPAAARHSYTDTASHGVTFHCSSKPLCSKLRYFQAGTCSEERAAVCKHHRDTAVSTSSVFQNMMARYIYIM